MKKLINYIRKSMEIVLIYLVMRKVSGFYEVYEKNRELHPENLEKTGCKIHKKLYTSKMKEKSRKNADEVDIKSKKLDVCAEKFYIPPIQEYFVCGISVKNIFGGMVGANFHFHCVHVLFVLKYIRSLTLFSVLASICPKGNAFWHVSKYMSEGQESQSNSNLELSGKSFVRACGIVLVQITAFQYINGME